MVFQDEQVAVNLEEENENFKVFLRGEDPKRIDGLVFRIQEEVTAETDCTSCGNCCRTLMINVEPEEIEAVSVRLDIPKTTFKAKYIEESSQGQMIMNTIPCHFLHENKCTVYESRFSECREFPHLHKPGFTRRLFGTFMHYDRCAIISGTIERLKQASGFKATNQ